MKKNRLLVITCSITALLLIFGFTEKQPKILIIGDSISLGYTSTVKEMLKDKAIVSHNKGNAKHSGYGLENLETWIQKDDYDIIQFNWGLWDLCYRHPDSKVQGNRDKINGTITFSLEEYEQNLEAIVRLLKEKTNAKLIFVTTSYVPKEEAGRFTKDARKYNKVAKKVMKKYSVQVNDIYKKSKPIHKKYGQGNNDVHYQKKGYQELGKVIATYLEDEIR
ncbi:SGNH/GDSL hydrolase family protein [Saccharicrinis sp. GN24d3]|uniref:SGNH/GDSL hydrolase family protein n=1 Tax=Saccharicrinis sp. GN24d3 TaxID=3458416 RepID=UPI0040372E85